MDFSLGVVSGGSSLVVVGRLLVAVASFVAEHRLCSCDAFSCSIACGLFPDQTSVSCIGRQILYH